MTPLHVCVTGLDGAGKSTQVTQLAEGLEREGRSVAVSTIWDPVVSKDFSGRALFAKTTDADGYLALLEPTSRMYFLCHGLREAYARSAAREPDVLLLNAYWYKYYATEVAHGGDPAVLRTIVSVLPRPDVTFYLPITAAEAARRKDRFSAYETGFAPERTIEAFEAFQAPALAELEGLADELDWVRLPAGAGPDELTEQMLDHLRNLAPRNAD